MLCARVPLRLITWNKGGARVFVCCWFWTGREDAHALTLVALVAVSFLKGMGTVGESFEALRGSWRRVFPENVLESVIFGTLVVNGGLLRPL